MNSGKSRVPIPGFYQRQALILSVSVAGLLGVFLVVLLPQLARFYETRIEHDANVVADMLQIGIESRLASTPGARITALRAPGIGEIRVDLPQHGLLRRAWRENERILVESSRGEETRQQDIVKAIDTQHPRGWIRVTPTGSFGEWRTTLWRDAIIAALFVLALGLILLELQLRPIARWPARQICSQFESESGLIMHGSGGFDWRPSLAICNQEKNGAANGCRTGASVQ